MTAQNHNSSEELIDYINRMCKTRPVWNSIKEWAQTKILESIRSRPEGENGILYMLVPVTFVLMKDKVMHEGYFFTMTINFTSGDPIERHCFLETDPETKIIGFYEFDDVTSYKLQDPEAEGE